MATSTRTRRPSGSRNKQSKHVRISDRSAETLDLLARLVRSTRQAIVDEALEQYRRRMILGGMQEAYAAMRQNSKEWSSVQAEFDELEGPIADATE